MARQPADRVGVLAARVRWLDRYRRTIAVVIALVGFGVTSHELSVLIGEPWPGVLSSIMAILAAVTAWWLIEVALAWVTALWETEHAQLLRDRGLPRAELIRRRQ